MALSASDRILFYSLMGVPSLATAMVQYPFSERRDNNSRGISPSWQTQDLSSLQTQIEAILTQAATDSDIETRVSSLLADYSSIATSPMYVERSGENSGNIVCHRARVDLIRKEVGNLVGMVVPEGGFSESYIRQANQNSVIGYR